MVGLINHCLAIFLEVLREDGWVDQLVVCGPVKQHPIVHLLLLSLAPFLDKLHRVSNWDRAAVVECDVQGIGARLSWL